jgi:hypothetical protein
MRFATVLALLLTVASSLRGARASEPPVSRFAVVVGNNRPEGVGAAASGPSSTLRYADDDAVAMHRLLLESGADSTLLARLDSDSRGAFPDAKPDGLPALADLEHTLAEVDVRMRAAAARGVQTELLFFYSGHGDVDAGEGFIVLEGQRLTRSMLFDYLSRSVAAHNHVFIDACKSYFLVFDRGPGGRSTRYSNLDIERHIPARLANTGFVLSTASDRESHEWERYQGGILSHELRSALRGAADTNLDGQISYAELGAFFTKANQAIHNPRFKPDFLLRAPDGNLGREILSWRASRPALHVSAGFGQPFYVESPRGERLLDAHPAKDQALSLHVGGERPLFVRQKDGPRELTIQTSGPVEVTELVATAPLIASRGSAGLAYEQLFSVPLHDADVREYEARMAAAHAARASEPLGTWRDATGIFALATAGLAVSLSGLSLATYLQGDGASQRELADRNRQVRLLNRGAIVSAGAAALAGMLWSWPALWSAGVSSLPEDEARVDGWLLDVQVRF